MADIVERVRRRLAPVSLAIWPSLSNPAWGSAGAARTFADRLEVAIAPGRITRKLSPGALPQVRGRFLVQGLDRLPTDPVAGLYTTRDMEDIARHGADWRSTRLGKWLLAALDSGRRPLVRGALITSETEIEAYYRGYLTMFESMRADGYRYQGDDHMCFGVLASGEVILIRRGTHRLAAAQILGLPAVTGRVTQIDRGFAEAALKKSPGSNPAEAILEALRAVAAA
jgi:hypothetical protein